MQWIKDKVGQGRQQDTDKQNFMIGSDRWTGSSQQMSSPMAPVGSFKNPDSAERAVEKVDAEAERNPYVQPPSAPAKSPGHKEVKSGIYPDVYTDAQQQEAGDEGSYEEVLTAAQTLVTIPGAVVHLVDDEESVHLATGDFSLVRFVQGKTKVVVIAKVGEDLKWPLVEEEPTVKLDSTHYFFTLKVPKDIGEEDSTSGFGSQTTDSASGEDTLSYGVTFPAQGDEQRDAKIRDLDYFLKRYSLFSTPQILHGEAAKPDEEAIQKGSARNFSDSGVVPAAATTVTEDGIVAADVETSAEFWTTVAPNVNDYNSRIAKWIATGAGHLIKDIFWLSDATVAKLDSSGGYMKNKFKPNEKKSKISPAAIAGVHSVRKISRMTDSVAGGILGGILYTTGFLASAVVNSPPGRLFFKTTPGEVALVSLDAFGTVFDAIEKAGRNVLGRSSAVTQDFVNHRYGESAEQLTQESLSTVGHGVSTVWNVAKIQKAFNPKALVSKSRMAKTVGKVAVKANKDAGVKNRDATNKIGESTKSGTVGRIED